MSDRICVIPDCGKPRHGRGLCNTHYWQCRCGTRPWPDYTKPTLDERFWSKVDKRGLDDCWPWLAGFYRSGYGQFNGSVAHRFAYETTVKPIPPGLVIDHTCGQRYCVNPAHLEAVTYAVNSQRGYTGSVVAARNREWARNRTHCERGHELTTENTHISKEGHRRCRSCRNDKRRERQP